MKRPSHLINRENSNSRASVGPQAFLQRYGLFIWGKVLRGGGAGSPLTHFRWSSGQR